MQRVLTFFVFAFCLLGTVHGQDRIYLMDGKAIAGKVLEMDQVALKYQLPGKQRTRVLKSNHVQSITYGDGHEEVFVQLDKIIMLNGKLVYGTVQEVGDSLVTYTVDKAGAPLTRKIEVVRVFAISNSNGTEQLIYKEDSVKGNVYTIPEMRRFIMGAQDAWAGYKPWGIGAFAYTLGMAGGMATNGNMFTWLAAPVSYGLSMGMIRIRGNKHVVRDKALITDDVYVDGYSMVARGIKNKYALFGAILGAGSGYAVVLAK